MAGVLMGIGEHAGVGFVTAIWATALELAADGDFSGAVEDPGVLVSGAGGIPLGCASDPGGVVLILQRVGLVATVPRLRVRGLDRYRSAWLKNTKSRGRPPGSEADPKRKTETETETETSRRSPAAKPRAPDSRHAPLVKRLTDAFVAVTSHPYPFAPRDAKAVTQLLALAAEPTILAAWTRALRHTGFPATRTLPELVANFAHFVGFPTTGIRREEPATPRPEGRVLL